MYADQGETFSRFENESFNIFRKERVEFESNIVYESVSVGMSLEWNFSDKTLMNPYNFRWSE